MTVKDLVERIHPQNIPIYFHSDVTRPQLFSTRIITAKELSLFRENVQEDRPLGIYLLNSPISETYDLFVERDNFGVKLIEEKIQSAYVLNEMIDMKYLTILFMILHEIGHWKHFQNSSLTGVEYWDKYGVVEDNLYRSLSFEVLRHPERQEEICKKYADAYRKIPMEAEADDYALRKMIEFM